LPPRKLLIARYRFTPVLTIPYGPPLGQSDGRAEEENKPNKITRKSEVGGHEPDDPERGMGSGFHKCRSARDVRRTFHFKLAAWVILCQPFLQCRFGVPLQLGGVMYGSRQASSSRELTREMRQPATDQAERALRISMRLKRIPIILKHSLHA
jgi:hypothetical protein